VFTGLVEGYYYCRVWLGFGKRLIEFVVKGGEAAGFE
jgi:hypothetical protein